MLHGFYRHARMFFQGNFAYLLISLILLFALRPSHQGIAYLAIWEFALGLVFFGSVFNINHPIRIKIIALCLNIPALILDWSSIFLQLDYLIVISLVLTVLFLLLSVGSLLYNAVLNMPATLKSLLPIICAYFMIGFAFGYMYLLAEYFFPGSIQLISPENNTTFFHLRYISDMLYFSFGNLVTVGAGAMSAVSSLTQTIAILESTIGQFYIAVLVSRVVSIYAHREVENFKTKNK